ncbi:putative leucine-rich repeat domain superfamily [Helianthus annuus]|nr:putative leucine-rich repeat domain superfamily [Helianthus annuus]
MAIKRIRKQQTSTQIQTIKTLRVEQETTTMADMLTELPESLQLHILSLLETKHAFKTSILSKSWASRWTYVPVLNFSSYSFKKLKEFDKFVFNTLSVPRSANLDKLTFKRSGICSAKILNKVFRYAFSQGVKELDASIIRSRKDKSWPIGPIKSHTTTWDSLTSLKLSSNSNMGCSFLGLDPRSKAFKNLTNLYLKRVIITVLDPFSGFPALKKLTLVCCNLHIDGTNTLNVHAPQLSELTIYYYSQYVNRCELNTPNLEYFECRGSNFPRLQTRDPDGLSVLETVVIDYNGFCRENQRRKTFDDLMMLFNSLHNAKSLVVYSSVVQLLSYFGDELGNRCSPFRELKCLKVDFSHFYYQKLFEGDCVSLSELLRLVPGVKGYLLQKSQDAKCTMVYPDGDPNGESTCSSSHASKRCKCVQRNAIKLVGK